MTDIRKYVNFSCWTFPAANNFLVQIKQKAQSISFSKHLLRRLIADQLTTGICDFREFKDVHVISQWLTVGVWVTRHSSIGWSNWKSAKNYEHQTLFETATYLSSPNHKDYNGKGNVVLEISHFPLKQPGEIRRPFSGPRSNLWNQGNMYI